jgi:hypothetical protein
VRATPLAEGEYNNKQLTSEIKIKADRLKSPCLSDGGMHYSVQLTFIGNSLPACILKLKDLFERVPE